MRRTPWSRIQGHNSVDKAYLEIVGNGKPTGSVQKETIRHDVNNKRANNNTTESVSELSCNEDEKKASKTRSPRRSPSGRMFRCCSARNPIHSVKSLTLQNACSARPRVVADFGEKCSCASSPG